MLEVRLIGTFEIRCDGKTVTLSSRAAQSLFAYLVLTAGTSHRREKLAGMFWRDAAEEKARASLRHELWLIHKTLPTLKTDHLIADDLHITFNASAKYRSDVAVLRSVTGSASIDELTLALSLYQGELLPGFYDDWITHEREQLQAVYERKMARLLEMLEREKRWTDILEWAERWISLGQGSEAAYRYLMIAYDALGDRAMVAITYQRCVLALRELDLEPSEQTRALAFKRTFKLNLPIPLTSFIGREKEIGEVAHLITKSRLVTLTGSGGVGKTRLAIQVAADVLERFPDGVWFIDLSPLSDPALVPNALAGVLDLQLMSGSNLSITDLIIGYLRSRRILVIFDNCEHLIDSCAQLIHSLLTACEHLSILATSREALRVSGEFPYRVPSLELPSLEIEPVAHALQKTESIRLFTERAAIVSPGFTITPHNSLTVARICKRLDGIALAIEFAAARVGMLTVEQILKRLDDRFNLLTGGVRIALPRHRTLRATIEWSYDLLSEKERLLFRRLAVFTGGWTLEAVETVCSGTGIKRDEVLDLLSQLVHKSLVLVETVPYGTRYRRLETVRQFAYEKLATSGEGEQIHKGHLDYFMKLTLEADIKMKGPGYVEWRNLLEEENANILTAMDWGLEVGLEQGQQLVGALWWFWNDGGHSREGLEWVKRALAANNGAATSLRIRLLAEAGWFAYFLRQWDVAKGYCNESIAMARHLGLPESAAWPLATLGWISVFSSSDLAQAEKLYQESLELFRRTQDKYGIRSVLTYLGMVAQSQGNYERAETLFQESLNVSRDAGEVAGMAWALWWLGRSASEQRNYARALELYDEGQSMTQGATDHRLAWFLRDKSLVYLEMGNYVQAKKCLEEVLPWYRERGDQQGMMPILMRLGHIARLEGDCLKVRAYLLESLQLIHNLGDDKNDIAVFLIHSGLLMLVQNFPEKFVRLLGTAEGITPDILNTLFPYFRIWIDQGIENARIALGEQAYTAAYKAGKSMSWEEATAHVLKEL